MSSHKPVVKLAKFLLDAKRHTYAGMDDDVTMTDALLNGSTQLEWQDGDWFYRDIYYGTSFFAGLEVVYFKNKPIWSMSYSGGMQPDAQAEEINTVYKFLRSALMMVSEEFPVRGPSVLSESGFSYTMTSHGDLESFWGQEDVSVSGACRFALKFSGGSIRL